MKSFKEYLAENDYPGGYYTQDMNRLVAHFNNAKEKEEFDADPRNDPNDELIYRSDKRMETKKLLGKTASTVSKYAAPIASTALKTALGNGLLSEVPINYIEDNIEKINDELRKVESLLKQIQVEKLKEQDIEKKKKLEELEKKAQERQKDLIEAWKKYQARNYD